MKNTPNNRIIEVVVLLQELMKQGKVLVKSKDTFNALCVLLIGLDIDFDKGRGNNCYIIELLDGE